MKKLLLALCALVLTGTAIMDGHAKEPTRENPLVLKLATHALPSHFLMAKGVFPEWAKRIEKETGGRVKIKIYGSQSLGKLPDEWAMLKNGVSDIGWIIFSFYRGAFPLSEVMSQPNIIPEKSHELEFYNAIFGKYLYKEYSEVKAFIPNLLGPTYLNTKKPVKTLDDIKGMQIRCASSQKTWLKTIGGSPVTLPPSELYTALERGIVEGCTFPMDAVKSYKLYEVTKYHTPTNLGMGMNVTAMNLNVWNSLPADIQKVFTDLNPWLQEKMYKANIAAAQDGVDECVKNGSEVIALSKEEAAKLVRLTTPLTDQWAKDKDAKGLPGTEILSFARGLLGK